MGLPQQDAQSETSSLPARDLLKVLAPYRKPDHMRSILELAITGGSFVVLWAAAWWALSISYWLTLAISVPAGAFLVRLFLIQHDCGHSAFFRRKDVNDWVGRILGVLTLTPYDYWRRSHAIHHATSGNLDRRGIGDIDLLTVREYRALPRSRRILYRLYRHPIVMFIVGPAFQFLLRNRLPLGLPEADRRYWISTMGTNVSVMIAMGVMIYAVGLGPFILVQLPVTLIASTVGVWLFYVQHQFEHTQWDENENWQMHDSALHGSSHYDLPGVLRWLTANIGVHHVHHLSSRIPFYRLPQVLRDFPELTEVKRLTLVESFACLKLRLWDESQRRLVSFKEARLIPAE
jgi:omega-6 fatty acid desaturase (delta-12 desaturase)